MIKGEGSAAGNIKCKEHCDFWHSATQIADHRDREPELKREGQGQGAFDP